MCNLLDITLRFYNENGARDPKYDYNSSVPILKLNCNFFADYDPKDYHVRDVRSNN